MIRFFTQNLELLFWGGALVLLYFLPVNEAHFTLCPIGAMGFSWCPGCGIGHSIHYLLHLDFAMAWEEHYLGPFAVVIILYRIFQLLKTNQHHNQVTHGQPNF